MYPSSSPLEHSGLKWPMLWLLALWQMLLFFALHFILQHSSIYSRSYFYVHICHLAYCSMAVVGSTLCCAVCKCTSASALAPSMVCSLPPWLGLPVPQCRCSWTALKNQGSPMSPIHSGSSSMTDGEMWVVKCNVTTQNYSTDNVMSSLSSHCDAAV